MMLLHDARRDARIDERGELVLLEEQDRTRWDRAQIAEGLRSFGSCDSRRRVRTVCDSVGDRGGSLARRTRRRNGLARDRGPLRDACCAIRPSPVIELNRAVAVAMADGPAAGLELIDAIAAQRRAARLLPDVVGARGFAAAAGTMERGGGVVSRGAGASGQRTRAAIYSAAARGDVGEDEAFIALTAGQ